MNLIILLIVISIIVAIFKPNIKGYLGEKAVTYRLSGLPVQQYIILNDVMLRTNYGTTQIDHIVVSVYGIFVIETKNYKGWITGSEYGEQWTKNMYGKKYSFRNPLKQNYAHVKALQEKMDLTEDKFIPIVAFSEDSDIKVKTSKPVVYIGQIKELILTYKVVMFREDELELLARKIKTADITNKETKKQHVDQIRTNVRHDKIKISQGICPKCGGRLVERKGKYGFFTGCNNYPKCRFTL